MVFRENAPAARAARGHGGRLRQEGDRESGGRRLFFSVGAPAAARLRPPGRTGCEAETQHKPVPAVCVVSVVVPDCRLRSLAALQSTKPRSLDRLQEMKEPPMVVGVRAHPLLVHSVASHGPQPATQSQL